MPRISPPSAGDSGRTVKGAAVVVCGAVAIAPTCSSLRPVPVGRCGRKYIVGARAAPSPPPWGPPRVFGSGNASSDQGMLCSLLFAPVIACRNARHATSPTRLPTCPTIVDVVGDLLTDRRRLEQVLSGRGVPARLGKHSILRRLVSQIVGVFHLQLPARNCSVRIPARFRLGGGQIEVHLHFGVSEPSQRNIALLAARIGIILRQLDFIQTLDP